MKLQLARRKSDRLIELKGKLDCFGSRNDKTDNLYVKLALGQNFGYVAYQMV